MFKSGHVVRGAHAHATADAHPVTDAGAALVPLAVPADAGYWVDELGDVARGQMALEDRAAVLARRREDQELAVGREADVRVVVRGLIVQPPRG